MPSAEQGGIPSPENPHKREEHTIYLRAAHFIDGIAAQQIYTDVQRTLRTAQEQGEGWGLAGYNLTDQEAVNWYVAVAGQPPPEALEGKLTTALAAGVEAPLPQEFHDLLTRHQQETPERTMTFDEWLAADEQGDGI